MRSLSLTLLWILALAPSRAAADAALAFKTKVEPMLQAHCFKCHGPEKQKGKVNLAAARTLADFTAQPEMWFRALEQIESGSMPPEDEKQPTAAERTRLVEWVRGEYSQALLAKQRAEGRAKFRRLTRNEYANTIEDIFGVRPEVAKRLTSDGVVAGYDKVSAALPLSAEGALGYLKMAEDLQKHVLKLLPTSPQHGEAPKRNIVRAAAMESGESKGHTLSLTDGWWVSFNTDTSSGRLNYHGARIPGPHKVRLSLYAYQTDAPLPFGIYTGSTASFPQQIQLMRVLEAPPGQPTIIEIEMPEWQLRGGMRLIPFGLGVPVPKNTQASDCKKPGLAVQWVEFTEPAPPIAADPFLTADFPPAFADELRKSERVLISDKKDAPYVSRTIQREEFQNAMRATFTRIAPRLFRRAVQPGEIAPYVDAIMRQADTGTSAHEAFFSQVTELLLAPEFLTRPEAPGPLDDFALASRLSYFLWNSTPDEALLALASQGQLRDPRILREQTERLLNDAKSARFVNDFADQWLGLRAIADTSPDGKLYPDYDELIRFSSVGETQGFLREMLEKNLGVTHLVAAPWTLLNEPLAKHYGLPTVAGIALQKVNLPAGSPYGGVWTHSAVMKVTANGTSTSPVKRGVWFAERLLGLHIPPPPPDITPIEPDIRGAKTLREQLELHRNSAACAACHAKFDGYGFALESFDVAGAYRAHYRAPDDQKWQPGLPVDPSGKTPGGADFKDIPGLRQHIVKNPLALAHGLAVHLVTYATGTPVTGLDQPAIAALATSTAKASHGFRSLVHAVVQSELFRSK